MLEFGSYLDIFMLIKLGRSTVYAVFRETMEELTNTLPMPGILLDDEFKIM